MLIRLGNGFTIVANLLPGTTVLAIGLVLTTTPLGALNLSSVDAGHSGIAAAVQNAVGRTSALTAVACVGLIAAGTLTDASFARLLQIAAALFFIAALIATVCVVNPRGSTEPVLAEAVTSVGWSSHAGCGVSAKPAGHPSGAGRCSKLHYCVRLHNMLTMAR